MYVQLRTLWIMIISSTYVFQLTLSVASIIAPDSIKVFTIEVVP